MVGIILIKSTIKILIVLTKWFFVMVVYGYQNNYIYLKIKKESRNMQEIEEVSKELYVFKNRIAHQLECLSLSIL